MRKIYLLLFTTIFTCTTSIGQVLISGSTGADGNYTSLTQAGGAFAALNAAGTQAGNFIFIDVTANVLTENGATSLNSGDWFFLNIQSDVGIQTLSGAAPAGTALININGADNIIIEVLAISNTTVSAVAGTSTIRFTGDATNIYVQNCTILGSSITPLGTEGGTIVFSTGVATGNDIIEVTDNNIGPAGINLPTKAIYSAGSTTNTTIRNSDVLISGNNIFDFFDAGVSVSGIILLSGNDNWTIQNNKLYQTAPRTFTTTNLRYTGITLNSTAGTAGAFTISGNTIGFGASNGTGTTTLAGLGNEFRGIDAMNVNTGTPTSIQGNTISGINQTSSRNSTATTSSCFVGIMMGSTGGAFNCGTTTGNNIGSLDASSTIVLNQTSTTVSSASMVGIYDFSVNGNNISNNNIGSITINNGGSGTTTGFRGILVNTGTGLTATINNNTIGGTAAGSITNNIVGNYAMYGIQVALPNLSATGNVVRNMSGNSNGAVVVMSGIVCSGSTGVNLVSQNTVHSLSNVVTGGSAGAIYALDLGFPVTANIVERNFIHSISVTSSLTAYQIYGIIARTQGTATYRNNMIRLGLNAAGTSITTGFSIVGIRDAAGTLSANNYFHNSIYIGGTGVVSVSNTYCMLSDVVTNTRAFQNNIFWNARSNASGTIANIAIRVGGTTANPPGLTSNFNDLYATGNSGATGVFNGLVYTTLAQWQTITGQDANSFAQNPHFVNRNGNASVADLHVLSVTGIEGTGTNIASVTNDFDGQARAGFTPVDIGADAGNFTYGIYDEDAPVITYGLLTNSGCTPTNPVLSATITDALSGVNVTAGTKPRIYFKKSTNTNTFPATNDNTTDGWKYTEATNAINPFSLTLDLSLIFGGVAFGDNVQYFVIAQDLAPVPNVAINSGSFNSTPSSVALTGIAFPIGGTINSFNFVSAIPGGVVTIGAAGTYSSLSGPLGLFADINTRGINGNLTANIIDASVTETGANSLNQMSYGCGGPFTLTIKPNAAGTTLTGSLASAALIKIKSSNVIIDGSSNGTSSRDLTITNTSTTGPTVVLLGSTGAATVINSTLKNTIIINGVNTSSAIAVTDATTLGNAGYFNNITIQNNDVRRAYMGIYANATVAPGNGSGLNITSNIINTSGADAIRYTGVYVQGVDGATISGNDIGNFETAFGEVDLGIWIAAATSNTVIEKNNIHDIRYTGTGGYAGKGITISTGLAAANINVRNNMIYGITGDGDSYSSFGATYCPAGIYAFGTGQGGINIYYNSIHLSGNTLNFSANAYSIGIALDDNSAATIKDNIVKNELGLLGGIGVGAVGIAAKTSASQFTALDYNDYYSLATLGTNLIGKIGGADYATLGAWQTATAQEANSLNANPYFVSATDLHLVSILNCDFDSYGTPIAGITTDYDNGTRDVAAPDMGADEFTAVYTTIPAGIAGSAVCTNKTVSPLGTTYGTGSCLVIAHVLPSGGSAVNGKINVCVTLDATPQTFNGEPYVQRHYDIEPVNTPGTATATIRLYFTNQEFVDYNTNHPVWPLMPTVANGANGDVNRANVRITQFHGTPTGGLPTSTPGNYTGARVLITPGAANVFWNGSSWEVTFSVTGFSGFYAHTTLTNSPLPVIVNYLTGRKQGSNHLLNWKVTCTSTPRATMTLERSSDSRNYSGLYTITADAARCQQPFDYTDGDPLKGMNYYRLKIVDADGKITYSTTVALLNAVKGFDIVSIAPNPVVSNNFKLNVASAQAGKMEIVIFDMQGRLVNRQTLTLIAGFNSMPVNVVNLSPGTYTIKGSMADDQSKVIRFVKQ